MATTEPEIATAEPGIKSIFLSYGDKVTQIIRNEGNTVQLADLVRARNHELNDLGDWGFVGLLEEMQRREILDAHPAALYELRDFMETDQKYAATTDKAEKYNLLFYFALALKNSRVSLTSKYLNASNLAAVP